MTHKKHNYIKSILTLTASVFFLQSSVAFAKIYADAELSYSNYDASDNSAKHISGSSFTQKYSLLYSKKDKLVKGRLGSYDFTLGYELLSNNSNIASNDTSIQNFSNSLTKGHIIYRGEVIIDPKEMPLRLKLYSRENGLYSTKEDDSAILGTMTKGLNVFNNVHNPVISTRMQPGLVTGIYTNRNISSGATLTMGVKNGMTNGYNEILRHFPMLLLDYTDVINQNGTNEDTHLSRLAFVSLNKKDNWFHYRYTTFTDNIDRYSSYIEKEFQLGTVDQTLQRRWIDFANWIQVSTDALYTKHEEADPSKAFESIAFNLFTNVERLNFRARSYNTFSRLNEPNINRDTINPNELKNVITYKTNVPTYMDYRLSPNSDISSYITYSDNHDTRKNSLSATSAGYKLYASKNNKFTLEQGLGIDYNTTQNSTFNHFTSDQPYLISDSSIATITASIGTQSTKRFSNIVTLASDYSVRYSETTNNKTSTQLLDQVLKGRIAYNQSHTVRLSAQQSFRLTSGTSTYISSAIEGASLSTPQYASPRESSSGNDGLSYQSVTSTSISWLPTARLSMGGTLSLDYFSPSDGESSIATTFSNNIAYKTNKLSLVASSSFSKTTGNKEDYRENLKSDFIATYIFNRNLDALAKANFEVENKIDSKSNRLLLEEGVNYKFYKVNGITRKLFEINQYFTSVNSEISTLSTASTNSRSNQFSLGAQYYPLRQLRVAGGINYIFSSNINKFAKGYYSSISLNYRLLEASVDYMYAIDKTTGLIEKKLLANMKKRF